MNQEPNPTGGGPGMNKVLKLLLRVALGVVIAVLLLFGVCLAMFHG